jgi:hypothetical protein
LLTLFINQNVTGVAAHCVDVMLQRERHRITTLQTTICSHDFLSVERGPKAPVSI